MPDSARYKETGEEVYAIDLYQRIKTDLASADKIKKTEYICLACDAPMKPVAILPDNIPVPYFRIKENHKHELSCSIYGYEKLVNKRRVKPVASASGFPCGYPNRLCLTTSIEVSNQEEQSQAIGKEPSTRTQAQSYQETDKIRNWEVKTIGPLVKQFVNLTHSRDRAIPLYVPGVAVATYGEVFQKLRYRQGYRYNSARIYFARLQYTAKIDFNQSKLKIPLFEGNWQQGRWSEQYFLEIDTEGWPESHKDVLKRQINACLSELNEKKEENNIQPWIFFLGQQATDDSCQFSLLRNDYRLLFYLVNNTLYAEENSTVATPHQILEESFTVETPTQETLFLTQNREGEPSINKPSIPLKPKKQGNQTPSHQSNSLVPKSDVIPKPKLKKDEFPQEPSEQSQYAYNSQSLPSKDEGTNKLSSQPPTNFRELEFDDRQNQSTFDREVEENELGRQSQNRRGSITQWTNWLKSMINNRFQQFKNSMRQIWNWLHGR